MPRAAGARLDSLAGAFTRPTFRRIEWGFAIPGYRAGFQNLPRPFRALLGRALAPAA